MDSYRQHLGRGFNWLGGATAAAKVIDFSTMLVVLLFLTKQQVGVAALVISVGMVIEAFDGLGSSEALVQAQSVNRAQLDSLFWYIMAVAAVIAGLTLLMARWIGAIHGIHGMAPYFLAVAAKQPLVGAALIPFAMMNRDLQYERIAIVNVCVTLATALTRLALAVAGTGTWALVVAHASSGLYALIGAIVARPFLPRLHMRISTILPLVRFGLRAAAANIFEQMFKNVHYLMVGWFYGASQLAVYRVAFDVAMEPALAVGTLVNRTALPVFARVATFRDQFVPSLTWSLRRIMTLVAPVAAGLILAGDPLLALLHDRLGNSYAAAAAPLKLLAVAALLRVVSQLLSPVMIGSGQPGTAARLSATTLLLLSTGILAAGLIFPLPGGIIGVSAVWLGVYPLLLVWGLWYLRRRWGIGFGNLAQTFIVPVIGIGFMVSIVEVARTAVGTNDPRIQVGIIVASLALTYAGLFLQARCRPHRVM